MSSFCITSVEMLDIGWVVSICQHVVYFSCVSFHVRDWTCMLSGLLVIIWLWVKSIGQRASVWESESAEAACSIGAGGLGLVCYCHVLSGRLWPPVVVPAFSPVWAYLPALYSTGRGYYPHVIICRAGISVRILCFFFVYFNLVSCSNSLRKSFFISTSILDHLRSFVKLLFYSSGLFLGEYWSSTCSSQSSSMTIWANGSIYGCQDIPINIRFDEEVIDIIRDLAYLLALHFIYAYEFTLWLETGIPLSWCRIPRHIGWDVVN